MAGPVSSPIRWVKIAFLGTAIVFVVHAILFFTRTAPSFVHSDAATEVLLTVDALAARSPLAPNFYYVNGDLWIFGSHWFAAPFVLLFGISPTALFTTNAFGLAMEVAGLTWAFHRLSGSWYRAAFASLVALFAWSALQMHFAYVEVTYGLIATYHVVVFVLYARVLGPRPEPRRLRETIPGVALFFLFATQNPTRTAVFALAPLLAGCFWKWEDVALRPWRFRVAAVTVGAWILSLPVHRFVLKSLVLSAPQRGIAYSPRGPAGMAHNVWLILRGLVDFTQPRDDLPVTMILGLALIAGAFAWTLAHARRSRTYEPMRFVCLVVLAELALMLAIAITGDILGSVHSSRYLMPCLIPLLGLGCLAATQTIVDKTAPETRLRLVLAWICLLPIDAALAASRRVIGAREVYWEADPAKQQKVADELVRRRLTNGFATYWHANAITLLANGATKTCGIAFRDELFPRKWLVEKECFEADRLPASIYVIVHEDEREKAAPAIEATCPHAIERFTVDAYEVQVFRTAECSLAWLERPRPGEPP